MSWVRFLDDRDVLDGEGNVIASFKKGERYDLREPSCRHWLDRGVVERCDPPPPPRKAPSVKEQQADEVAVTVSPAETEKGDDASPSLEGAAEDESKVMPKRTPPKRGYGRSWRK